MKDQNKNYIEIISSQIKKWGMNKWIVVFLIGILLLIICIPVKQSGISSRNASGVESLSSPVQNTNSYMVSGFTDTSADPQSISSKKATEEQLTELLQKIDGVGQVEVMITGNSEYNQIEGVVVVAEGADSPAARQEIIETVQALFPIAAYKVKVCKMAGGKS
ncbi:MAG: hypothetical protein IJ648_02100 [Lachnospiraceae bacterium]|nr:hypothetical protein [Lachnospiraceae bacterium]